MSKGCGERLEQRLDDERALSFSPSDGLSSSHGGDGSDGGAGGAASGGGADGAASSGGADGAASGGGRARAARARRSREWSERSSATN